MSAQLMVNTLWVLMAAFLVFFMNTGFAMLESGLCRAKNTVNILAKNFMVFGIALLGFWAIGYALAFGSGNAWIGGGAWFLTGLEDNPDALPKLAFFLFQLCFAATAATIVSGAVAERVKLLSFLIVAAVLVTVIYPIVVHWAWSDEGWLLVDGFTDFAGSTVVHSVGGWAALTGALVLGPRIGKYDKNGRMRPIPGHNLAFVTLGGLILWLGWFGFNGGSGLEVSRAMVKVCVTTALAAAAGTVAAAVYAWLRTGKPDLTLIINGMLGGLVGITAGCANVDLWAAAVIGALAGVLVIESVMFFDRIRVDDPVGATSVHLVCGIFGTLMVGVVGYGDGWQGLVYGGGAGQLWVQLKGVVAVGVFVSATSLLVWLVLKWTLGVRVSEEEEMTGLDITEMGLEAYPHPGEREGSFARESDEIERSPSRQSVLAAELS